MGEKFLISSGLWEIPVIEICLFFIRTTVINIPTYVLYLYFYLFSKKRVLSNKSTAPF